MLRNAGKYLMSCGLTLAAFAPLHAAAQDFRILYTFQGGGDGDDPNSLIRDRARNLYGSTQSGGGGSCYEGCGVIVKLAPDGTKTVLYTFAGGDDGSAPVGALVTDEKGNFYGEAVYGGASGNGTVFKLAPDGRLTALHAFAGGSDGVRPYGGVIADANGNLYGTTVNGGDGSCEGGCGIAFEIASDGTESILHTFKGAKDGAYPFSGLMRDRAGNLYGTTDEGGKNNDGTVFRIAADGRETVLHAFSGGSDGVNPQGGLILDRAGNLVGTSSGGSTGSCGNVFSLTRKGGSFSVLYTFGHYYSGDACMPLATLLEDRSGNFYGTTAEGGANEQGSVFKLAADGTASLLYSFTAEEDGYFPQSTPIADARGRLYATADGVYNGGTVFRIKE